jgi:hypothetical protein
MSVEQREVSKSVDLTKVEGLLKQHHKRDFNKETSVSVATAAEEAKLIEEEEKKQKQADEELDKAKEQSLSSAEKAKIADRRIKIRAEIISTEESYVKSLYLLHAKFVLPLRVRSANNKLISPDHVAALLNNVETVIKFHHSFLQDIQAENSNIPQVFIKYADIFLLYTQYLQGYERSLNSFQELRNHKKFQEFLNEVKAELIKQPGGLDLMSYMIMPVQRIPRYVLLLTELQRNTLFSNAEYQTLLDALFKMKRIAMRINEAKRDIENMQALLAIAEKITGGTLISITLSQFR